METMEAVRIAFQPTPREIVVLVMNHAEEIRSDLATLLEDEGYTVIEVEDFAQACALIDAAATPMVAIVGSVGIGDQNEVECFTAVTASSATCPAYIYVTDSHERHRLPTLVYILPHPGTPRLDRSFELVSLLALVAQASTSARTLH
jgi:DNA-binding NtrC family response regulator